MVRKKAGSWSTGVDASGHFRKALALARFPDAHWRHCVRRKDLPLPGASWPGPRIAELAARARAWLVRLGASGTSSDTSSPPFAENLAPDVPPPAWSLALHALDMTLDALALDEVSRRSARLAFRVRHAGRRFEGIDVLLQPLLRGGRVSQNRLVDPDELLAAADMLIDSEDSAAVVVLTDGVPQAPRTRPAPSRARLLRLLATLVGHPRVFLGEHPTDPAIIQHARLGLEFVDAAGGLVPRFTLGGARWTADELLAHMESAVVVDVDATTHIITMAPIGAAVLVLVQALQRHQPVFPEESHRELRRRLSALQHAVDLHIPDGLAGPSQGRQSAVMMTRSHHPLSWSALLGDRDTI